MTDVVRQLSAVIVEAAREKRPLCIRGGGTKDFYGGTVHGYQLSTTDYRGIVAYEPTELVITARAGTPLTEIEAALHEKGQMLAFEPPHYGSLPSPLAPLPSGAGEGNVVPAKPAMRMATLGGCVAAGLSGPRRPYAGAVRDFVLGVRMLDGKGDDLRFGGQVMKNVAGYDLSRLMAGSLGTLGLLLEVSLKVLPLPASETTLRLECGEAEAITLMNQWAAQPLPITASAYRDGDLHVRLSGARVAVDAAAKRIGGKPVDPVQAERFWAGVRDHTDPYFAGGAPLWRLAVKATTPPLGLPGKQFIEWGGALRWLVSDADPKTIRADAARAGGHATLFRNGDKSAGVFHPLAPALMKLHRNLKHAFDPAGILNPGRLYADL
jgi:glycolate oxidase FAD binding subunit